MPRLKLATLVIATLLASAGFADDDDAAPQALPSGQMLTPLAAPGARLQRLNPGLPDYPDFTVDHAISLAISPDHRTALILTSGFNKLADGDGKPLPSVSGEYVLVFDLSDGSPRQIQAITIANSFAGIVFAPDGRHFYVGGGSDDTLLSFALSDGGWDEAEAPLKLGHAQGLGLNAKVKPGTAGLAISGDGKTLLVVNLQNDSLSKVDLASRQIAELDLRPGKGKSGGTYPFWVAIKGNDTAYVSSLRDRQLVVVDLPALKVTKRIPVLGNPNRMVLDKAQRRLFVTADNSDRLSVVDTVSNKVVSSVKTTAPPGLLADAEDYRGAAPNALFLSEDERRLYVSNGGANDIAVIDLTGAAAKVVGLIPTGWYPSDVGVVGEQMLVLNGKSNAGPNPGHCSRSAKHFANHQACRAGDFYAGNSYIEQLEKASLLTLSLPKDADLEPLTRQVAANNYYQIRPNPEDRALMAELHRHIRHVIYVIKENRTFDQVLGDLGKGNGDPSITEFGRSITPNHHKLAEEFVTLDNFYDSGEVSGDGWAWSTMAREPDIAVKQVPVNYAGRGLSYDTEGTNRGVNVSLDSTAKRRAADPDHPNDPDLLPGTANVAAPDPAVGQAERGYLWDAALRAKLSVRNYGFFLDLHRYDRDVGAPLPIERDPFASKTIVAYPTNASLAPLTDPYFRGFDNRLADFWREREWEREFDLFVAHRSLPSLSLVRLMHDHFGDFKTAQDKVDVPEMQMADNDYALGRLVEKVANSPYADQTLIFVVEDDAQDGPDHVDAHRSLALVIGPYVRQGAVVSKRYSTVNMLRTIEDVLGIDHLSLNDAYQRPMSEIFDLAQKQWSFHPQPADILYGSDLPLPRRAAFVPPRPSHDAVWWAERSQGMDFTAEDKIDAAAFNRLLWQGLMVGLAYPAQTTGKQIGATDIKIDTE